MAPLLRGLCVQHAPAEALAVIERFAQAGGLELDSGDVGFHTIQPDCEFLPQIGEVGGKRFDG
jgi:hypothetical protein